MAVHFIMNSPHAINGAMMHRADTGDLQVGIIHDPKDGYKLGFDGQIIKETLGVKEFIKRLSIDYHGTRGYNPVPHEKMDHDIRRVLSILHSRREVEILHMAETFDRTYSNLIMRGKLILAEHKLTMQHSNGSYYTERESLGSAERSVTQSRPITPDEAFTKNVNDKEVYYLLT